MDRRTFRLFAATLGVLVLVAGAAALLGDGRGAGPGEGGDQAVGVVVAIDSEGLDRVHGFTLRTAGGELVRFRVGTLENGVDFPPGHLAEHQATAEQVRVWYREADGERVAYRLEDAEEG